MATQRTKVVGYRRTEWVNANPASISLALCIKLALAKSPDVADRTVSRSNGQFVRLADSEVDAEGGYYLHFTVDTPGEAASTVPKIKAGMQSISVTTADAPPDREFMDGDAFLYIRKNDVCLCATQVSDGTLRYVLAMFFRQSGIRSDADQFVFSKVANLSKISMLQSQGVKEITLKGSVYEATAKYLSRKGKPAGLISQLAKDFKALLGIEHDANRDGLRVAMTFVADNRMTGITVGSKQLEKLAIMTVEDAEDGDEFVIETKLGQKITQSEIFIKSAATMESLGKSVAKDGAWAELKAFYESLSASGALEV